MIESSNQYLNATLLILADQPLLAELFACSLQDSVGSEAELLLQILERCGRSKGVHANNAPFRSRIVRPAKNRSLLDRDPCGDLGRKYLIAVTLVLMFEQVPRRHADDARPDAFRFQFLVGVDPEVPPSARDHPDHLRFATFRIGHDVSAASHA